MTTALETAFPAGGWGHANVRAKLAECGVFLTSTANLAGENFTIQPWAAVAVYGPNGDLEFYAYDSTDTTTVDDGGASCIVVSGRRYKKRIDVIVKDAATSATTTAQPASPTLGDTYIVPAAPSGADWASEAKTVAQYTARGWIFRPPSVGMVVYVEDEAGFRHYDAAGDWLLGLGAGALPDGSVRPTKLFYPFGRIKVVDQRNAPPIGTPTNGTAYQVGTSPTGLFATHSNHVAMWNSAGTGSWEFFTPVEGDEIYRIDIGVPYTFRSGVWGRTIAAAVVVQSHYVDDVTVATSTAALTNRISSPSITAVVGQKIRVTCMITAFSNTGGSFTFGIRLDTAGAVTKQLYGASGAVTNGYITLVGEIAVPDASAHVYRIASTSGGFLANVTSRAIFEVIQPT